jgi:hypothetical protein
MNRSGTVQNANRMGVVGLKKNIDEKTGKKLPTSRFFKMQTPRRKIIELKTCNFKKSGISIFERRAKITDF